MSARAAGLDLVHVVDVAAATDETRLLAVLAHGVTALWLRDPDAGVRALLGAATSLRSLTRRSGALLLVGDHVDVALAAGADGLQLGRRSPPVARVRPRYAGRLGASCHDEAELRGAQDAGADHLVVSPVFAVPGKGAPLGVDGFARLLAVATAPVVALGGIDASTVGRLRALPIAGVAVTRALRDASDPARAAHALSRRAG